MTKKTEEKALAPIPAEAEGVENKISTPEEATTQLYVVLATKMGADYHRGDIVELADFTEESIDYLKKTKAIRKARASDFEVEEDEE